MSTFNRTNNDPSRNPDYWIHQISVIAVFSAIMFVISIVVVALIIKREIQFYREPPNQINEEIKSEIWTDMTATKDSESEELQASSSDDEILKIGENWSRDPVIIKEK